MLNSVNVSASTDRSGVLLSLATPTNQGTSFAQQLADALRGFLDQSGNSSNLEIDIQATGSQNPATRQFVVTVKQPAFATPPALSLADAATAYIADAPATNTFEMTTMPGFSGQIQIPTWDNLLTRQKEMDSGLPMMNFWRNSNYTPEQIENVRSNNIFQLAQTYAGLYPNASAVLAAGGYQRFVASQAAASNVS